MADIYDWLAPAPFWETGMGLSGVDLLRPAILQLNTDKFMPEFLAAATAGTAAGWQQLQSWALTDAGPALKLFQPAHGAYYLVCASLCCRQPAFPDRNVRRANGESVYYVLRKIDPQGNEYGWSVTSASKTWVAATATALVVNEEQLPLFNTSSGGGRSLVYGYIAVSSRDTTQVALPAVDSDPSQARTQLMLQFDENISRPLGQFAANGSALPADLVKELSLFLLSDLSDFLKANIPDVYAAVSAGTAITAPGPEKDLYDGLGQMFITPYFDGFALSNISAVTALQSVISDYDAIQALNGGDPLTLVYEIVPSPAWYNAAHSGDIHDLVNAALPATPPAAPQTTTTTDIPKLATLNGERYQLRCVYERPCDAPFPPRRRISQATYPFDLAAFFDTDAPARPIRIEMPIDVSIAAMRKFKRGVGFALSNTMRGKMAMIVGNETNMLTGGSPGPDTTWGVGMICSFSIQIIFIVAFMLLLIFVVVLNIVFWWLPFFRICLPYPKEGN